MNNRKTLLIAFPFAGGNSYSYNFLKKQLSVSNIHLETLEYPGRGKRAKDALITDMDKLITDLLLQYKSIVNEVKPDKIVFYGHSIGSVIGLAIINAINKKDGLPKPNMAIFSGHGGPQQTIKKIRSSLPSPELIDYFQSIGSLPKEVAEHADLMDYMLPILRNDLVLYENYNSNYEEKLNIPLAIVNGDQDNILQADIDSWQFETVMPVDFHRMEGHHFFISQDTKAFSILIINLIAKLWANADAGTH